MRRSVKRFVILPIAVGLIRYHFEALNFIPLDLNDRGWIVGEASIHPEKRVQISPVLFRNGRETNLGRSGSAKAINLRGDILITCSARDLPESRAATVQAKIGESACLLWRDGKSTYLGKFEPTSRLLNRGQFLARQNGVEELVTLRDASVAVSPLPTIPPHSSNSRSGTFFTDLNERGTFVGITDFGTSQSHAFVVTKPSRVTDLHPNVELHTGWTANQITEAGAVLGYQSYDFSVGGGTNWIWHDGQFTDLPSAGANGLPVNAISLNNHEDAIGNLPLFADGATSQLLENKELDYPFTATARSHAMMWTHGRLYDLNDLSDAPKGYVLTTARKINDSGWIIGTAVFSEKRVGFVLKPITS